MIQLGLADEETAVETLLRPHSIELFATKSNVGRIGSLLSSQHCCSYLDPSLRFHCVMN